ncbi:MAG: LysE family translocator, partial [Pseudomonadota bacterium]
GYTSAKGCPMLAFVAAVFFLIVTPGPGVLSTAGVAAAFGAREGLRYVFGLFIGNNLVALAVLSGVAAVVLAAPWLRLLLYGVSVLYLLFLAFRIAFAGSKLAFIGRASPPGVWGGVVLQPINPKAYVVNTTLFAGFSFMPDAQLAETLIKLVILNAIWVPIHIGWLYAGVGLKRLNLSDRAGRGINIAMALAMLLVVGLAALSPPTQAAPDRLDQQSNP